MVSGLSFNYRFSHSFLSPLLEVQTNISFEKTQAQKWGTELKRERSLTDRCYLPREMNNWAAWKNWAVISTCWRWQQHVQRSAREKFWTQRESRTRPPIAASISVNVERMCQGDGSRESRISVRLRLQPDGVSACPVPDWRQRVSTRIADWSRRNRPRVHLDRDVVLVHLWSTWPRGDVSPELKIHNPSGSPVECAGQWWWTVVS